MSEHIHRNSHRYDVWALELKSPFADGLRERTDIVLAPGLVLVFGLEQKINPVYRVHGFLRDWLEVRCSMQQSVLKKRY